MNLHQDFKMVKQVLMEQRWTFKHPSLFNQQMFQIMLYIYVYIQFGSKYSTGVDMPLNTNKPIIL